MCSPRGCLLNIDLSREWRSCGNHKCYFNMQLGQEECYKYEWAINNET